MSHRFKFILLEMLLFFLLIFVTLGYSGSAQIAEVEVNQIPESPTIRLTSLNKEVFLTQFDLELDFWLSIIPNQQLVYDVMDSPYGIPKALVFALVSTESEFNPRAIGRNAHSEDYGLFQLNSTTYANYTKEQLLHPDNNIALGMYHLYTELERFDWSVEHAVKAYNAGPARVRQNAVPESTERYWAKVRSQMQFYQEEFRKFLIPLLYKR